MQIAKCKLKIAATITALLLLATLHSPLAASAAEPTPTPTLANVENIREAFLKGGPLASCWNVNAGWNLNQQVAWIQAGHHYMPTIYVPLSGQGANKEKRWNDWYAENREALEFINEHKLPSALRWHNWLAELTEVPPEERGPFETSPLVHRLREDGSLDSIPVADPFGPIEPWRLAGEGLGGSYWLARLAEVLPDVPRFYAVENNEGALHDLGKYTTPVSGNQPETKDAWGYRRRIYRENLAAISVRAAEVAATRTEAEFEVAMERGYRERYEALTAGLLAKIPPVWRGKVYTGGYGGLGELAESGLLGRKFSYLRPEQDWDHSPWAPAIWRFTEPSDRCYDDGSGSPWNWHDFVRGPHILQHNLAPLNRYLEASRPLWHDDRSFWMSPQRSREAAAPDEHGLPSHGGYVLPERVKGFARAALWSDKPRRSALVLRWFAASQVRLEQPWFAADKDPAELKHLTHGDYFAPVMEVCDEVWRDERLLAFWRDGQPVLSPDPPLCDWELPPTIGGHALIDDRSRVLMTDADPPRFDADGKDLWRAADGKLELKVFAQAYRLSTHHAPRDDAERSEAPPASYLLYAWSPRETRDNVTVQVPQLGPVTIPLVGPEGVFHFAGASLPDVNPPPDPDPDPDPTPDPLTPAQRAAALLREALELLEAE